MLVIAGSPSASEASALLLVGALLAQFVADSAATRAREGLHRGASPREQFAQSAWIYLIDALLAPLGFGHRACRRARAGGDRAQLAALLLLAVFGRERDERSVAARAQRGVSRHRPGARRGRRARRRLHRPAHPRRRRLAVEVAEDLGLDPRKRRLVEFGALLHDVGKIAIPKEIINKPGPLDDSSGG